MIYKYTIGANNNVVLCLYELSEPAPIIKTFSLSVL